MSSAFRELEEMDEIEESEMELWHGSRPVEGSSHDLAVARWFSPDWGYANEYGEVARFAVQPGRVLDIRAETEPANGRLTVKTVGDWVELFQSRGVAVSLLDADYAEEDCTLWDLLYGEDVDFTHVTDLAKALIASEYDTLLNWEVTKYGDAVEAYGLLRL